MKRDQLHRIHLSSVGWYHCPPVHSVSPNLITEGHELVELLIGGKVYHEVNGQLREFGSGTIFWEEAGDETLSLTTPDAPYRCAVILFSVPPGYRRPVPMITQIKDEERAMVLCQELFKAFHDDRYDKDVLSQYAYSRLLWEAHAGELGSRYLGYPRPLRRVLEHIDRNPAAELTVPDLSNYSEVSIPHLHALFREHLDTTPHQYVLDRRIQAAKALLASTEQPVKQVSFEAGFNNTEGFCRTFRKRVGITPSAYREKYAWPYA